MNKQTKKIILITAGIITALSAINWGLTTLNFNLINDFFPYSSHTIIFFIIGIAGILTLISTIKWAMKNDEQFDLTVRPKIRSQIQQHVATQKIIKQQYSDINNNNSQPFPMDNPEKDMHYFDHSNMRKYEATASQNYPQQQDETIANMDVNNIANEYQTTEIIDFNNILTEGHNQPNIFYSGENSSEGKVLDQFDDNYQGFVMDCTISPIGGNSQNMNPDMLYTGSTEGIIMDGDINDPSTNYSLKE